MENDSKTHWVRFFTFVGILISINLLLNIVPKRDRTVNNVYWPYFYEELPENSVDIVFLGNSHAQCTFIPEIIDELLGTESINLITPGESIYQTKYEYQEVLRYQHPMAVIIETGVIYGGKNQSKLEPFQFSFFDSMPFSLRKLGYIHEFFSFSNLIKYYFPYTMNHTDWKTPSKPINRVLKSFGKENLPVLISSQGYSRLVSPLLSSESQINDSEETDICPVSDLNERLASTENILRINNLQPSKLLFIEAPTYPNIFKNCESQTSELLENYGISPYQLLDNTDPSLLWFHDSGHLTQYGAIIATIETAQLLSEKLNIKMNLEALEYFKSYKFQDYTLIKEGKRIDVILKPSDVEASKNLMYQWEVIWKGKSIHKVEMQGGNEFDFILPDSTGNYLIDVRINNPVGDYFLEGEFFVAGDKNAELTDD